MSGIDEKQYFEKKMDMIDFIIRNEEKYGEESAFALELFLMDDICFDLKTAKIPVEITQLFSKFHVYKEGYDKYDEIVKILEQYSFLEGNCCEVAAGKYPRLAELTAPKIKLRNGSLTIYEPKVLFKKMKDITIVKEKFTKNTNIDKFDTLYALYPCQATTIMAEKAFEEDKNLLLAFCSCDHSTPEYQKWVGKYWAEDFCMDFREKYGKEAEIIKWPSHMGNDLPIMIRQSSKHKVKK